jgi:NAD(P)-dependent dehydrogenase (short-subunit alcohol dehydrogenase family)
MRIDNSCVAIVTGGASGLGEATVRQLRGKGARVVVADLNEKAGQALASELGEKDTIFFKTDVTNEENIQALVGKTVEAFGRVSAVINCAGVIHSGMFVSSKGVIPTKALELAFRINVYGTFNVCKHAALQMSKQEPVDGERGVLINVASVAGF